MKSETKLKSKSTAIMVIIINFGSLRNKAMAPTC